MFLPLVIYNYIPSLDECRRADVPSELGQMFRTSMDFYLLSTQNSL